jgi:hypothetical protein
MQQVEVNWRFDGDRRICSLHWSLAEKRQPAVHCRSPRIAATSGDPAMRYFAWLLAVPILWLDPIFAQQETKKSRPDSSDVEVRFNDDSVVRMAVLQESIEVATRYGKLTVPTRDIRRIDFGAHLADGLGQKIQDLIQDLGSKSFQEREAAGKQLLAIGPKAYAALGAVAQSKDSEISHRAQALVQKLKDQFTAQELIVRENDLIQTAEFPIVGRVVSPTLRTRTAYFGEPQIQVSQLRSIRSLAQGGAKWLRSMPPGTATAGGWKRPLK